MGLAAETGSGKTLAYLAPLISSLLREKRSASTPASAVPSARYSHSSTPSEEFLAHAIDGNTEAITSTRADCAINDRCSVIARARELESGRKGGSPDLTAELLCCPCSKHERHYVPDGILVLCPDAALSTQVHLPQTSHCC